MLEMMKGALKKKKMNGTKRKRIRTIAPVVGKGKRSKGRGGALRRVQKRFIFDIVHIPYGFWTHMARANMLSLEDWIRFGQVSEHARLIVCHKLPWKALVNEPPMHHFRLHRRCMAASIDTWEEYPCSCLHPPDGCTHNGMWRLIIHVMQTHMCLQCGTALVPLKSIPIKDYPMSVPIQWCQRMHLHGIRCPRCFRNEFGACVIDGYNWFKQYSWSMAIPRKSPRVHTYRISSNARRIDLFLEQELIDYYVYLLHWRLADIGYDSVMGSTPTTIIAHRLAKLYLAAHRNQGRTRHHGVTLEQHLDRFIEYAILYASLPELTNPAGGISTKRRGPQN